VKKQTSLFSYLVARGLTHDQMTQQKIRDDNRGNKDLQGKNGLPDIHSTEGKPLVQLRQPSMTSISNVPIRCRATPVLVADTLSSDHVGDNLISHIQINWCSKYIQIVDVVVLFVYYFFYRRIDYRT